MRHVLTHGLRRRPAADPSAVGEGAGLHAAAPLAAKAELILGLQLASRHRAVRLAALVAVGVAATAAASAPSVARVAHVMLGIGGTLAALGGSRLLASGPALAAARMVVAPWWLAPVGRLLGALSVIVPATLGLGLAMLAASHGAAPVARLAGVTAVYAAAVAATAMALAPLLGATASACVGVLAVWLGAATPSAVGALLAAWPPAAHVVVWAWHLLPLPWRAGRWLDRPDTGDLLLVIAWALLGIGLAGWRLAGCRGGGAERVS